MAGSGLLPPKRSSSILESLEKLEIGHDKHELTLLHHGTKFQLQSDRLIHHEVACPHLLIDAKLRHETTAGEDEENAQKRLIGNYAKQMHTPTQEGHRL